MRNKGGELANRFILVANLEAEDGGKAIVAGNERVIAARLSDAKFFFEQDRKIMLPDRVPKLKEIVFHEKLGSQYERVQRVWRLAREIAPLVGADPDLAERAAILAKADLVSVMVGEFPELQGVMGRYYALDQEENTSVADAIAAHYKPLGPSDDVPREPVAIAVALADKLDMLVGLLGDRREADRLEGSVRAPPRRARRHPHRARERSAHASVRVLPAIMAHSLELTMRFGERVHRLSGSSLISRRQQRSDEDVARRSSEHGWRQKCCGTRRPSVFR